jgi:cephalosporin hydroxylase
MHQIWDEDFDKWRKGFLEAQSKDEDFSALSKDWFQNSVDHKYSYQFDWLGVPIIQMPGDLVMFQDIVFRTQPDLIIETGVARGGSLIFWASMQNLCGINGKVLGIDIDIRDHAINAIKGSRFIDQISLLVGSSTNSEIFSDVKQIASQFKNVMVVLDSNHTHDHVLEELKLYSDLVSSNCFLLVLDTVIDDLKADAKRNWGPGKSPKSAVIEFMSKNDGFVNMKDLEDRANLTVAPHGYWLKSDKRTKA